MFFYGMSIEAKANGTLSELVWGGIIGVALTAVTGTLYLLGLKSFNLKHFFQITTGFLFVTSCSLLLTLTRKLIQSGLVPPLRDQIWDTSFLLDERSPIGQIVSTMTGYESSPSLMVVLVFAVYWPVTLWFFYDGLSFIKNRNSHLEPAT